MPRGLVTAAIISHEREREKRYAKIQQQTKHKNSEYQAKDGINQNAHRNCNGRVRQARVRDAVSGSSYSNTKTGQKQNQPPIVVNPPCLWGPNCALPLLP